MIEENQVPQQYRLKVMDELLVQAKILGIDAQDLLEFLGTQIQGMLASPPNLNYFGKKARVWIMRGFYPKTTLFFKLVMIDTATSNNTGRMSCSEPYFVKASPLRVSVGGRFANKSDRILYVNGRELNENTTLRMENTFFGAKHEIKKLIATNIRMPRCISPKGMPLFRYEKPSRRKNETTNSKPTVTLKRKRKSR